MNSQYLELVGKMNLVGQQGKENCESLTKVSQICMSLLNEHFVHIFNQKVSQNPFHKRIHQNLSIFEYRRTFYKL